MILLVWFPLSMYSFSPCASGEHGSLCSRGKSRKSLVLCVWQRSVWFIWVGALQPSLSRRVTRQEGEVALSFTTPTGLKSGVHQTVMCLRWADTHVVIGMIVWMDHLMTEVSSKTGRPQQGS